MAKEVIKSGNFIRTPVKTFFNFPLRIKYILLVITGMVFYANSIFNKYVLDDDIAIVKNTYVQMGFAGIPKILTHDSYASYYATMDVDPSKKFSGGRFRPLSEIIFAMGQQLLGNSVLMPYFLHLVNIFAYIACIIAIFYFLENFLFKKIFYGSDIAFLSTVLFAIHPLHTEVVANIKSLDEILSLLFIILTFIYSLKYLSQSELQGQNRGIRYLIKGTGSFLLALLSKEYAITLVLFIPFLFYLLKDKNLVSSIRASIPYYGIVVVYLLLRYSAVGFHYRVQSSSFLIDNPYLYATHTQKVATEWFVLGKYLGLLVFPYPLSYDYSYNQIPYRVFSDASVLLSILLYLWIFIWGIRLFLKKNVLSFAVFFFLLNILMISNFLLDIGATMGERLVFHSSLGFAIIVSYYFFKIVSKIPVRVGKSIVGGFMVVVCTVCFIETIARNAQWRDAGTLYIHDIYSAPNSFVVNSNAGWSYSELSQGKENTFDQTNAYLDSAHKYCQEALNLNGKCTNAYLTLGIVCLQQGQFDSAKFCLDMVERLHPHYISLESNYKLLSRFYFSRGLELGKNGKLHECIVYMKKALLTDSINPDIWYNMGVAYSLIKQYDSAKFAWVKALQYKPDSIDAADAKKGLQDLPQTNK